MAEISLEGVVLSTLDATGRQTLHQALAEQIKATAAKISNKDVAAKLDNFLSEMPKGDDGILATAKFLSELCFGGEPVDAGKYTFDAERASKTMWPDIAEAMKRYGFAIVRNYVAPRELAKIRERVDAGANAYSHLEHSNDNVETDRFYFRGNNNASELRGYKAFAEYPKAVVMGRRTSYDNGIVDVFNFDYLDPWLTEFSDRRLRHDNMTRAFLGLGVDYVPKNLNFYLNDNTTNKEGYSTRDFHYDGIIMSKNFLYLTDVPDDNYGPYTFIPKTHRRSVLHLINGGIAKAMGWHDSDLKIIDRSTAVRCHAPAGTLILSSQAGAHRGITQAPGCSRQLLTQAYFQKGNSATPELNRPASKKGWLRSLLPTG